MSEQVQLIREAAEMLRRATSLPVNGLSDDESGELLIATEELGRATDSMRALTAADINFRSRYTLGSEAMCRGYGYTKGSHLIEYLTRISSAEAARRIRLGTAIMPRTALDGSAVAPVQPIIADAVISGDVGVEVAGHLLRLVNRTETTATETDRESALTALVEQATQVSCDLVAVQARQWAAVLDTDGIEPREEQLRAKRGLWLGRESNGMTPFTGALDPVSAGILTAIFTDAAQATTPRFVDTLTGLAPDCVADGDGTPADDRSRPQRDLDVLLGTVKAGLRASAKENGGMRPTTTVSVHVTLQDLENGTGVGWIDGVDEPISVETVRALMCDGTYEKVLLGNAGEVLYLSTTHRFFDSSQRRGMAARDGGCVWKNCPAPARQCDAHHVIEWDDAGNGPTNIDNGVLLCSAHHQYLHASRFQIRMITGKPHLLAPAWIDPTQTWTPMGKARTQLPPGMRRPAAVSTPVEQHPYPTTSTTDRSGTERWGNDRWGNDRYPYPTEPGPPETFPYPTERVDGPGDSLYPYPTEPGTPEEFPYPTEPPNYRAQCLVPSTTVSAPASHPLSLWTPAPASSSALSKELAAADRGGLSRRRGRCNAGDLHGASHHCEVIHNRLSSPPTTAALAGGSTPDCCRQARSRGSWSRGRDRAAAAPTSITSAIDRDAALR